jgi:uncharacterized protein (TIGR02996 family)
MTNDDFLQGILAHPDDDVPRLIYADWLEERGDPRGEFIRVQCELYRLPKHDKRRAKLGKRERALLSQHAEQWAAPLEGLKHTFHRGFVEHIEASVDLFLERAARVMTATPIRSVRFGAIENVGQARALTQSPWLRKVTRLGFRSAGSDEASLTRRTGFDAQCVQLLLQSPHLGSLAALELTGNALTDRGLQVLADSPRLVSLRFLNLTDTQITPVGIAALTSSKYLGQLQELDLSRNAMGIEGARALGGSAQSRTLTRLVLRSCGLGTRGLQTLCSADFSTLQELDVQANRIGSRGGAALAGCAFLDSVEDLHLGRNRLEDAGVTDLAASSHVSGLKRLDLRRNRLTDAGAQALSGSTNLRGLVELNLSGNRIGPAGVCALADATALDSLKRLDLRNNPLEAKDRTKLRERLGRQFGRL